MVSKICSIKNQVVEHIEHEMDERGLDRINIRDMGEFADVVKDLSEAEKDYWKAQYYRNLVTDAMEAKYGSAPIRSEQGMDIIDRLDEEYRSMSVEDRALLKSRLAMKLGSM